LGVNINILNPRNQWRMRLHPEQRLLININNHVTRLRDLTFRVSLLDHMHTMRICAALDNQAVGKRYFLFYLTQ